MNKKTIFQVIIKTIGLLTLKEFVVLIPSFFALYISDSATYMEGEKSIFALLTSLSVCSMYILIIYLALFKSGVIIEKLRLVEEDNEVLTDWYFDIKTLVSLAIIVIGLNCIIEVLPTFIRQLIISLKGKAGLIGFFNGDQYPLLFPIVKLVLGFLLVSGHKTICNWIVKVSETKEDTSNPEEIS